MGEARGLGGLTEMVEEALDGQNRTHPGLTVVGTPYQPSRTCAYINTL